MRPPILNYVLELFLRSPLYTKSGKSDNILIHQNYKSEKIFFDSVICVSLIVYIIGAEKQRKGKGMSEQDRKRQIKEISERQIDRVYRIARICTGDPHDAEDVAESVFLTVIEKEIAFENEDHEKAWFITSVRNRCKDLHKSSWHGKVKLVAPADMYAEQAGRDAAENAHADIESETENEAVRLLMMLPEDQREAVYLCYYEGYTVKEAASIMGIKETKLRSALTAAKRMLRGKRDE